MYIISLIVRFYYPPVRSFKKNYAHPAYVRKYCTY